MNINFDEIKNNIFFSKRLLFNNISQKELMLNNIDKNINDLDLSILKGGANEKFRKNVEILIDVLKKQKKILKNMELGNLDEASNNFGAHMNDLITKTITKNDLDKELVKFLSKLTFDKNAQKLPIVGSYKYSIHAYPGDIDMMEICELKGNNLDEARDYALNKFIDIAKDIKLTHYKFILADFKCGFWKIFDELIDCLGIDPITGDKPIVIFDIIDLIPYFVKNIVDFNKEGAINCLEKIYSQKSIKKSDYQKIKDILVNNSSLNGQKYFDIYSIIRKYRLIRWGIEDIIQGYRILYQFNGDETTKLVRDIIPLKNCFTENTPTKMDLWGKYDGEWIEVTNFYIFKFQGKDVGYKFPVGVNQRYDYDLKFYSSPEYENGSKLAKRIWNRAIYNTINNRDPTQLYIAKIIYPLFKGDFNKFSQIKSVIEILISSIEKQKTLYLTYSSVIHDCFESLQAIPSKLFRITLLGEKINLLRNDTVKIIEEVDSVFTSIGRTYKNISDEEWDSLDKSFMLEKLEKLEKMYKHYHGQFCKSYLVVKKLHPALVNSIVKYNYAPNYLNLPESSFDIPITQKGEIPELLNV